MGGRLTRFDVFSRRPLTVSLLIWCLETKCSTTQTHERGSGIQATHKTICGLDNSSNRTVSPCARRANHLSLLLARSDCFRCVDPYIVRTSSIPRDIRSRDVGL